MLLHLRRVGKSKHGKSIALYRCSCGMEVEVLEASVRSGRTTSCGCVQRARTIEASTKHGMCSSPEYATWTNLKTRATNVNTPDAKNYVDRGIVVCPRWAHSFANFFADMGLRPSPKHTIERKDNDGPYSPKNCVWATRKVQNGNTRRNVFLEYAGERLILSEWARRLGCGHEVIRARLRLGWSVADAVTRSVRPMNFR